MENLIIYNHLFLILNLYVFRSREKRIFECCVLGESDNENKKMKKKTHFILKKSVLSIRGGREGRKL